MSRRALWEWLLAGTLEALVAGCVGVPPTPPAVQDALGGTPAPTSTAVSTVPPRPTVTPTATVPPPPFKPTSASASIGGRLLALRASDFDLVNGDSVVTLEPLVLLEARAADLNGDGNDEVFAAIVDGPIFEPGQAPGTAQAYAVYFGLYYFDTARGRLLPLRQEVVAWRRYAGYYPKQMWCDFADVNGDGHKEVLLYSAYGGTSQALQFEVLSLSGRRLTSLLKADTQQVFAIMGTDIIALTEPGKDPLHSARDGLAVIVSAEPAYRAGDASWHPSRTRLRYFVWNGHDFALQKEEEREGYPARPRSLP